MSGHEQISEIGQVVVGGVATEAKQDAQIIQLDEIKSKQDTANTKLDTANSNLVIIQGKQDTSNTKLDTINSNLVIVQGKQDTTNIKIDSTNTKLDTIDTDIKTELPRIIRQHVEVSQYNEKNTNIGPNETWTGQGESSLGVAGLQVNFAASTECLVQVQQSNDNINWDVRDAWIVPVEIANEQSLHGRTVQATGSYFRVRVTNLQFASTTYFRLSVALCPIIEVLPRSLTDFGNLKVAIKENDTLVTHGGLKRMMIHDNVIYDLLSEILMEMKISNIHLSKLSDINVSDKDKNLMRRIS